VTGSAVVNHISPKWVADAGLDVETQIEAHVDAKVRVHVDPLVGGGVGTTVGLVGNASANLGGTVTFTADGVENARVLVARPKGGCGLLTIALATDGKAKTDFGWMTVPSIGIIRHQPLDLSVIAPSPILDDMPRTIDGRGSDGNDRVVDLETRKLTIEPVWRYMNTKVSVLDVKSLTTGWQFDARIEMTPSQDPIDVAAQASQRERIRAAVAQPGPSSCADDGSTEITFGDLKVGPNGEVVKFLVSVGKFTKEMGERIGHEVSTAKLKEWVNDPAGSFTRSDPGKLVDGAAKVITQPVQSYCAHNWCP
jgi:hypothetical protein